MLSAKLIFEKLIARKKKDKEKKCGLIVITTWCLFDEKVSYVRKKHETCALKQTFLKNLSKTKGLCGAVLQ